MIVLGCDPGYEHSALVGWDTSSLALVSNADHPNNELLKGLRRYSAFHAYILAIEQIESMGMPVGKTVFETVYWCGQFAEAFAPNRVVRVPRKQVKLHLCGSSRGTDATIRQALIDRFGPSTAQAIGTKKDPGPLHGLKGHQWQAFAVAVTWADQHADDLRVGVKAQW